MKEKIISLSFILLLFTASYAQQKVIPLYDGPAPGLRKLELERSRE